MIWNWFWFIIVFLLLTVDDNALSRWTRKIDDQERVVDDSYALGKTKLNNLRKFAEMPQYGECWIKALHKLETGCQYLTDDMQHRMALHFANCFLLPLGRATYPCGDMESVSKCTEHMTPEAYITYAQFFSHTLNMCVFLQDRAWREEMGHTINRLSNTFTTFVQQLEVASVRQGKMLAGQNKSIENQGVLLRLGDELKTTLEESSEYVRKILDDTTNSTRELILFVSEIFDRLNSLHSLMMGDFIGLYSYIFYIVSIVFSYYLTSAPRTRGARLWLNMLVTLNIVSEYILVSVGRTGVSKDSQSTHISANQHEHIYVQIWWCRNVFMLAGFLVLVSVAYNYRDVDQINNQLMVKINNQLMVKIDKQLTDLRHRLLNGRITRRRCPCLGRRCRRQDFQQQRKHQLF